MKFIYILCEGETEEKFVKELLQPHFWAHDKHLQPVILHTKRDRSGTKVKGGVSSYEKIRRELQNLLRDSHVDCVTTFLDYYGLPEDFPGKAEMAHCKFETPYQRVTHLEKKFAEDIDDRRFLPYIMLHEFEAVLFIDLAALEKVVGVSPDFRALGDWQLFSSPEEMNDGKDTHPSARLGKAYRGYRKVLHGSQAVMRIGLERIREKCPHLDEWIRKLEEL
jgi:hypothetical protein